LRTPPDAEARRRKPHKDTEDTTAAPPQQDPMEVENSGTSPAPTPEPTDKAQPPQPSQPSGGGGTSTASAAAASGSTHVYENPGDKAGRFMASAKLGPAICLYNCTHQGAFVLELGFSVLPNKNAYLLLPLQFQFGLGGAAVIVPLGFQYDVAVPWLPGLYIYPRFSIGYALLIESTMPGAPTVHSGTVIPEFGVKYVFRRRWNFGGEIFSLPLYFGQMQSGAFLNVYYRILLSAGVNF
jgi:hypothetical protein